MQLVVTAAKKLFIFVFTTFFGRSPLSISETKGMGSLENWLHGTME
jgi:hypothetical protein